MRIRFAWAFSIFAVAACGGDDEDSGNRPARFTITIENLSSTRTALSAGVFETAMGSTAPGPIAPGGAYEFTVRAPPGASLNVASMLIPSNDLFIAPRPEGLSLFLSPTGQPASGDLTAQLRIWDAGTEADQPLGEGNTQANDQAGGQRDFNIGPRDMMTNVREVQPSELAVPLQQLVRLTVTPDQNMPDVITTFTVRIENVSTNGSLNLSSGTRNVLFSPGLYTIQAPDQSGSLFTPDSPDRGLGLESLAEDGRPSALLSSIQPLLGPNLSVSPGVWAVFTDTNPLFTVGMAASAGLEALAEDGDPMTLANELSTNEAARASKLFDTPMGASAAGPIGAGQSYRFSFTASPPATMAFATMYVQSNDVLLATPAVGIPLFTAVQGGFQPVPSGPISNLALFDAGTETNEEPGFGPNQPLRQNRVNTGVAQMGLVQPLAQAMDGFIYAMPSELVSVSLTSQPQ